MNKSNPAERLFLGDSAAELLMEHTIDDLNKKLNTKELVEIDEIQLRRMFALEGLNVGNWDKAYIKGDVGTAAGFGEPTAEADDSIGHPSVEIIKSGPPTATVFHFKFHNIKGEQGIQGKKGDMPPVGVPGGAASLGADGKVPESQLPPLDYIPLAQRAVANGVATLGSDGTVPLNQLPPLNYIPTTSRGNANGVASLDSTGKVPSSQIPGITLAQLPDTFIPTSQKAAANGVATLDANTKIPVSQIPVITAANLPDTYVSTSKLAVANGVATLGSDGKVPTAQLPSLDYVPLAQKAVANGVATLDANKKVPRAQLPDIYHVGTSAPSDTKMIWIDSGNKNILKFYNGSAWTTIGSVWS